MNRKFILLFFFCACVPMLWAQQEDQLPEAQIIDSAAFARIDSLAWVAVQDTNTIEAYQSYLLQYSRYAAQAQSVLDSLMDEQAWAQAVKADSRTLYEAYLKAHTLHATEAQQRLTTILDEQAWGATLAKGTRQAYVDYADKWEKYRAEAREWVRSYDDEQLWRKTVQENSISAVATYFDQGGVNHVEEAAELSARIERQIDMIIEAEALLAQKKYEDAFHRAEEVEALGRVPEYLRLRVLTCKEVFAYTTAAYTKSQEVIVAYLTTYAEVASERHMTTIQKRKK